jgi:hypothetical protein
MNTAIVATLFPKCCTNCGLTDDTAKNGDIYDNDPGDPINWRTRKGYNFCSEGCEAVYMDFLESVRYAR